MRVRNPSIGHVYGDFGKGHGLVRCCEYVMSLHSKISHVMYIQKAHENSRIIQWISFCPRTPLDKPPRHMRKDHPSVCLLWRFQLDCRPATGLKQVLLSRSI